MESHVMEQEGTPSMDPGTAPERASSIESAGAEPDAIDFVRFCYRRRHVGWPELYDEMCAVAGRGLYHGYCAEDLGRLGIGFALYEMPALATIVQRVVAEDQTRRRLSAQAARVQYVTIEPSAEQTAPQPVGSEVPSAETPGIHPRLVAVTVGSN
jgi:hypothetical protein